MPYSAKSILKLIFCASSCLLPVQSLFAISLADPPLHGQLRTEAHQIVGQNGEPVVLRGGGMMDLVEFNYTPQTINYLKATGANVVRIPLHWGRGGLSDSYERHFQRFTELADHAIQQGLYVIADFHAVSYPEQKNLEATAQRFFKDVTQRYAKSGQVLYEIFNEPTGQSPYSKKVSWEAIKSYAVKMIDLIRARDPHALIIVPTATWSQEINIPVYDPIKRPNLIYAFHFYATLHLFNQQNEQIADKIPLFVTEWAAQSPENSDGSIDFANLERYTSWMLRKGISWTAWSLSDEQQPYGWFNPGALEDGQVNDEELRSWGRMVRDLLDDGELNQSFSW